MTSMDSPARGRWTQLIICILCMVMIANLQYGWTLFVSPINKAHGWAIGEIQVAFALFVALETWLTPFEGWIVDWLGPKHGPKWVVAIGGILVGIAWVINSKADSLTMLYVGSALAGVGAGAIYATCVGNAVKWFPDRRGLAVGLTAAGFGAGAAITVIPISHVIASDGYQAAFFWFGLVQGAAVFVLAWVMRGPLPGEIPTVVASKVSQSGQTYTPGQMLITPVFWLLYVMFVVVSASGLMATAQIAIVAKAMGVATTPLMLGATTLTVALLVDNVANGAARPLFGWISDMIGRENTMAIAFGLGGLSYWLLGAAGTQPWTFVLCAGLIFLTWGEIFSLFPSTCTDTFGSKFATANLCFLYTAKGASAFLVPWANQLIASGHTWAFIFTVTAVMNFVVVALALFVLKPMRAHYMNVGQPPLGRLKRAPYFMGVLAAVIVALVALRVSPVAAVFAGSIAGVVYLYLAAMRLNDAGRNGWWAALLLLPLVNLIVFIYLCCVPSFDGPAPSARGRAEPRLPA